MKKFFKKMSAFILTAAMVTGMCMTSFAASEAKGEWRPVTAGATANLTVGVSSPDEESANGGDKLLAYKVVEIAYDDGSNNLTYAFTEIFTDFLAQNEEWKSLEPKGYGELNEEELKGLLGSFTSYIKGQEPKPERDYEATADDNGIANFGEVAMGQYIIVGDGTSEGAKIYQTVTAEVEPRIEDKAYELSTAYTVAMKTSKPSIGKDIEAGTVTDEEIGTGKQDGDKHDKHQSTSEIGKEITYKLTVAVPTYPEGSTNKTFYVGDILSKGLDLTEGSIIVTGYEKADSATGTELAMNDIYTTEVTVNKEAGTEVKTSTTLYVDFDFDKIAAYHHVVIQYKAVLNENAELGTTEGNTNHADLIYSNSPFDGSTWTPDNGGDRPGPGEGFGQDEDMEIVYTYALVIDKFEEKHEDEKLSGAVFEIHRAADGSDEAIATITTDENGAAIYKGLEKGTYYLKEIVAPTGYNLMDELITIEIDGSKIPYYTESKKTVTHYTYTSNIEDALDGNKEQAKINGDYVWLKGTEVKTTPTNEAPEGFEAAYIKSEKTTIENVIEIRKDEAGSENAANGFYKAGVSNNQGAHLPSTGGIGTTIFTVIGLILMFGAAILLITRRRMSGRE